MIKHDQAFRKKILIPLVSIGVVMAGMATGKAFSHSSSYAYQASDQPTTTLAAASLPPADPSHLVIPAISVDAKVEKVGLTASYSMGVPSNFTNVAWYRKGTIPGKKGSAVMAGHLDNALAISGVFKHLADLKGGDDIYVVDENGNKLHFVVQSLDRYDYREVPTADLFGEDDGKYLKLVTCAGHWVQADRTYDERLIVTAVFAE